MKLTLKNSIIDDYITIVMIENFCNNDFSFLNLDFQAFEELQLSCFAMKKIYLKLINILKLNNTSFCVLNNQLTQNNNIFNCLEKQNFNSFQNTCALSKNKLLDICENLEQKLKKLKINPHILSSLL